MNEEDPLSELDALMDGHSIKNQKQKAVQDAATAKRQTDRADFSMKVSTVVIPAMQRFGDRLEARGGGYAIENIPPRPHPDGSFDGVRFKLNVDGPMDAFMSTGPGTTFTIADNGEVSVLYSSMVKGSGQTGSDGPISLARLTEDSVTTALLANLTRLVATRDG